MDLPIKYLKKFLKFNSLFKTNQIRIVFSHYLLSKCYLELHNENKALENIRSAIFELFDFNNHFDEENKIEPCIMIFCNGILMQTILLHLSEILIFIKKRKLAANVLSFVLEISPYTTDFIQAQAVCYLSQLFIDTNPLLNKIENRLLSIPLPKEICFLASFTLVSKWISINELKLFNIKMIKKFLSSSDKLFYWNYASSPFLVNNPNKYLSTQKEINDRNSWMYFFRKGNTIPSLYDYKSDCEKKEEEDLLIETVNVPEAIDTAIRELTKDKNNIGDKYIFNFIMGEDIKSYKDLSTNIIEQLNKEKISLFTLCFGYDKLNNATKEEFVKLHSKIDEGLVFWVNDFHLVKLPFQNITKSKGTKNLFKLTPNFSKNIC